MKSKKLIFFIFLLLLLQIPLILPFSHKGLFTSHDDVQVVRIFEMYQSIKYGGFPSFWSSGLLYGHGYPLFTFYSPLAYLIGSLFVFVGANYLIATKLVFISGFFVGAVGLFLLAKRLFKSDLVAFVSATAYSLAPYRAVDVYVRGALAEFIAFSLMPWIIWINLILWENKSKKINFGLLFLFAVLLTLLILSHNLSALILLLFLVPLNIYLALSNKKIAINRLISIFLSGVVAFVLSCFYWLPILIEQHLVRLGSFSNYPYYLHYQTLSQLWDSSWGFLGSNAKNGMSLMLGKIIVAGSIAAFAINNMVKTKLRGLINTMFLCALVYVFFETKYSSFLWDRITIIHYLQFPWRLHTLLSIILSLLTGSLVYFSSLLKNRLYLFVPIIILFGLFYENIPHIRVAKYSEEPIASETTTWDDEYMPLWVKEKPKNYAPDKIWIASGSGVFNNIEWGYLNKDFSVQTKDESHIKIAQVYYPGWQAYIDGSKTVINYDNNQGLMTIIVQPGTHNIKFAFQSVWYRRLSQYISLTGLILGLIIVLTNRKRNEKNI